MIIEPSAQIVKFFFLNIIDISGEKKGIKHPEKDRNGVNPGIKGFLTAKRSKKRPK